MALCSGLQSGVHRGVRGREKPAGVCANLWPSPLALLTNASSTEHGEPQHSLHRACSGDGLTWGGEGLDCLLPVRTHGSVYVPTMQGQWEKLDSETSSLKNALKICPFSLWTFRRICWGSVQCIGYVITFISVKYSHKARGTVEWWRSGWGSTTYIAWVLVVRAHFVFLCIRLDRFL